MLKASWVRISSFFGLLLALMAIPRVAQAYVDPGSGTLLWQIAASGVVGSLFFIRRFVTWVRTHLKPRSTEQRDAEHN